MAAHCQCAFFIRAESETASLFGARLLTDAVGVHTCRCVILGWRGSTAAR